MGRGPNDLWYSSTLEREPNGFFLSALPSDTYLLNTYYILSPTLGIVGIFKTLKHDFCPEDIYQLVR